MKDQTAAGESPNKKLINFLGAGFLNSAFGYSAYAALVFIRAPYLIALLGATVAGVIFNYFSFGQIVFKGRSDRRVFGRFVAAYAITYSLNAAMLWALTGPLHLNPYLTQMLCMPASVALSWFLMNYWVYRSE